MNRITLSYYNDSNINKPIDFNTIGLLGTFINATTVSVKDLSIPHSNIPLCVWKDNTFFMGLVYNDVKVDYIVVNVQSTDYRTTDYSRRNYIYDIDKILAVLNTALYTLITANVMNLPSPLPAYFLYDYDKQLFKIYVPKNFYENSNQLAKGVQITFNCALQSMLASLPISIDETQSIDSPYRYRTYAKLTLDNQFTVGTTPYLEIKQLSCSTNNFSYCKYLLVTTSMPISSESFYSINNQNVNFNILRTIIVNYNDGASNLLDNINFTAPSDPYYLCNLKVDNLSQVGCAVSYATSDGTIIPVEIPPYTTASLFLEFN